MMTLKEIMTLPAFLIRRCNQISIGVFLEETEDFDLTTAQWGALALIANEPGMDQTRLMERSALDRSSITKCVERLEDRGAITRKVHPSDKRARHLFATSEGIRLLEEINESVKRSQERLLEPLGERAELFVQMLQQLADAHNLSSRVPVRDPTSRPQD